MGTFYSPGKIGVIRDLQLHQMDPDGQAMLVWELQRGVESDAQDKDISIQKCQATGSAPSSFSRALQMSSKNFSQFSVNELLVQNLPPPKKLGVKAW